MGISNITGKVKASRPAVPQIYAYTTPQIKSHDGWTKIGYTEQDVETRVYQQTHTADVEAIIHWKANAVFEGEYKPFKDTDFHSYLRKLNIENKKGTEWFKVGPSPAKAHLYDFRENRGVVEDSSTTIPYELRREQQQAVADTLKYARLHEGGEFLWNAKPRFGKTLTTYDFCKQMNAEKVLIVTNRPAIANSWYEDYEKFLGLESGYHFVSGIGSLRDKKHVKTYDKYLEYIDAKNVSAKLIYFVSLQDLKGARCFGGNFKKLKEISTIEWDVLVIDEAHEGVDTIKTDVAFTQVNSKFVLHLSGTPFKAIANEKFPSEAIFNWTYSDEQRAKRDWDVNQEKLNPYANLPQLNMFTYKMSDIVLDEASQGIELDGSNVEYAFDLNEFFGTSNGLFVHNDAVDGFLNALVVQKKFPFSTPELRDELRHTFWMLNRVDSARALASKLKNHPVFKEYEIVLAAGDGKIDDDDENIKSYEKVKSAIKKHDKTITLSVGQLTTGVTIPEWTAVLMLSNMKSPALYIQAAFRAQNPCLFERNGKYLRKQNAYVFDFDPARTLTIFEEYANDLYSDTAAGGGETDTRKRRIRSLLNFFPVLGEDDNGEMIELDAERVLSIPRKIRSQEVVRRGFMSDYLFCNISNIFHAPEEIKKIVQQFEPFKEPNEDLGIHNVSAEELYINEQGEIEIPQEEVIGLANDVFGQKKYEDVSYELVSVIERFSLEKTPDEEAEDKKLEKLKESFSSTLTNPLIEATADIYSEQLPTRQKKKINALIKNEAKNKLTNTIEDYKIKRNTLIDERQDALESTTDQDEQCNIKESYDLLIRAAKNEMLDLIRDSSEELIQDVGAIIVREIKTAEKEATKKEICDGIRDHLRGFSRTIPSFLMAYGDENTTLETFDDDVPEDVFLEVTSITKDQFHFLRDGGEFLNEETGEYEHYEGGLFDPVVFNDSVKEFIRLRGKLANYFDEEIDEDIFDYIPPQQTNQIFTPRKVVADMVDMFEAENPGCFDNPEYTFADLYMKSGLYITEIIKRLYRSKKMCELYPDDQARLKHILENQVFGIAPTQIIYEISRHYILGYNNEFGEGLDTNLVCCDTAELAKAGKLSEYVDEVFGHKLKADYDLPGQNNFSEKDGLESKDWILDALKQEGIQYIDKRESGGNLWVVGDNSIQPFMYSMEKRGAKFTFTQKGGKASSYQPAWYIPASAAERALNRDYNEREM